MSAARSSIWVFQKFPQSPRVISANFDTVSLNIAPCNLGVVEPRTTAKSTANLIAFFQAKTISIEKIQNSIEQLIVLRHLRLYHRKPFLHLNWSEKVCPFKPKCIPLVISPSDYPISLTPFPEVVGTDVASCGNPISGCAFQLIDVVVLVDGIRTDAILIRLLQVK